MKKLFLLPILALSMSGCSTDTTLVAWTELDSSAALTITYGTASTSFIGEEYSSVLYRWTNKSNCVIRVEVQTKSLKNENIANITFIGTNINIVVWGY